MGLERRCESWVTVRGRVGSGQGRVGQVGVMGQRDRVHWSAAEVALGMASWALVEEMQAAGERAGLADGYLLADHMG
jgi:hypothetical protein